MDGPLQDLPPPPTRVCFISPLEEHRRILLDLNNTVVLQPLSIFAPPLPVLRHLLLSRYGGSIGNWNIRMVSSAFLIKAPDWLNPKAIFSDLFWELFHLEALPWQTLQGAIPAHERQRVAIKVWDFPLDFWHPEYFQQATISMGEMVGLAWDTMTTGNMANLIIYLDCPSIDLIPPSIRVFHDTQYIKKGKSPEYTSPQHVPLKPINIGPSPASSQSLFSYSPLFAYKTSNTQKTILYLTS